MKKKKKKEGSRWKTQSLCASEAVGRRGKMTKNEYEGKEEEGTRLLVL